MSSRTPIKEAIGSNVNEFAKALGVSESLVYKWMQPTGDWSDSGALNPLDRIDTVVNTSKRLKDGGDKSIEDPLSPIKYLARNHNGIFIEMPDARGCLREQSILLMQSVKEFGEYAEVSAQSLEDGTLTKAERKRIAKEGYEAIEKMMAFIKMIEEIG